MTPKLLGREMALDQSPGFCHRSGGERIILPDRLWINCA
jgi:hypothetical protein